MKIIELLKEKKLSLSFDNFREPTIWVLKTPAQITVNANPDGITE